jgi:hypothetical protein
MSEDPSQTDLISELLETIQLYENICTRLLAKGKWSINDELEYDSATVVIERCEGNLRELGWICEE